MYIYTLGKLIHSGENPAERLRTRNGNLYRVSTLGKKLQKTLGKSETHPAGNLHCSNFPSVDTREICVAFPSVDTRENTLGKTTKQQNPIFHKFNKNPFHSNSTAIK